MPDQPDDAQKQQRKSSVLPPFFAPRQPRPTTPASPSEAPRRRTSQLFTPPGVARQPREGTPRATPAAPETPVATPERGSAPSETPAAPSAPRAARSDVIEVPPALPAPPERPAASQAPVESAPPVVPATPEPLDAEGSLVIERSDYVPISLSAGTEPVAPADDYQIVAYDQANSLLESQRRAREARAAGDALELEETEWSIQTAADHTEKLQVESFWAAEPLSPSAARSGEGYDASDDAPDDAPTAMLELSDAAATQDAVADAATEPPMLDDVEPEPTLSGAATGMLEPLSPPSTTAESTSDAIATPPRVEPRAVEPPRDVPAEPAPAAQAPATAASADVTLPPAARESAEMFLAAELEAEAPEPAWAIVEEIGPPEAPGTTPEVEDEMSAALAWPESAPGGAAADATSAPAALSPEALGDALRASAAAWSRPTAGGFLSPDAATRGIAAALERIAQRVRMGDIPIADDAAGLTDEGALAVTLAALLRGAPRQ